MGPPYLLTPPKPDFDGLVLEAGKTASFLRRYAKRFTEQGLREHAVAFIQQADELETAIFRTYPIARR